MRHPLPSHRIASILLAVALASLLSFGALAAEKKKSSKKNFIPSESVGKRLLRVSELAEEENFAEAE